MKEIVKKLYILQIRDNGIPKEIYNALPENERSLLIERNGRFVLREEERKKIKVVLTGGVFDVLHIGHITTLKEAKSYGDVLVVSVAKDEMIRRKNREPVHMQEERRFIVENLKPVDIALNGRGDPVKLVEVIKPEVIVYGYDQNEFIKPDGVEIVKLRNKVNDSKFKSGKIIEEIMKTL